jgi:hypothetical protein
MIVQLRCNSLLNRVLVNWSKFIALLLMVGSLPSIQPLFAAPPKSRVITEYSLTSANDYPQRDPKSWRLLGSPDGGKTWVTLDARTNEFFSKRLETKGYNVKHHPPYSCFRLEIDSVADPLTANSMQIGEIRVKGFLDGQLADLTPNRGDVITVEGDNAPVETRRHAFDSNPESKWLDFALDHPSTRSSWIQWEYDVASGSAVDFMEILSKVSDLHRTARKVPQAPYRLDLKAQVRWIDPASNLVVIEDVSGAALIQLDSSIPDCTPGRILALQADALIQKQNGTIRLQPVPLVNNDGLHSLELKAGSTFLAPGDYPISVHWFNRLSSGELNVDWECPGITREAIPSAILFHRADANTNSSLLHGLNFRAYEGVWDHERMPDFQRATPVKTGIASNFDIGIATRQENVAAQFEGYIRIQTPGLYTFFTESDDGSQLFLGTPEFKMALLGSTNLIPLRDFSLGQVLLRREEFRWSRTEGVITFLGEAGSGNTIYLNSEADRIRVYLGGPSIKLPQYLNNARIRATGICLPTYANDRQRIAGGIIVPGVVQLEVLQLAPQQWERYPVTAVRDVLSLSTNGVPVHLKGHLTHSENLGFVLEDASGQVRIEGLKPTTLVGSSEIIGLVKVDGPKRSIIIPALKQTPVQDDDLGEQLPVLTAIEQVQALSRAEAERAYPVKVRGVVTSYWPDSLNGVIQDSTRGVFVPNLSIGSQPVEIGDYLEIEGTTDPGGFAPYVQANRITRLGSALLPEPARPTYDELMNGSMDMQYVELRGVVTSTNEDGVTLLMRGGRIRLVLDGDLPDNLERFENALVRIRAPLSASWNPFTRRVISGEVTLHNPVLASKRNRQRKFSMCP